MITIVESVFRNLSTWGLPALVLVLGIVEFSLGLYKKHWDKNERILDIVCYTVPKLVVRPLVAYFGLKFLPILLPEFKGAFEWVPFWWGFLIICVADDLTQYWYHRLHHEVPFLWRFHRTHHSAPYMGMAMASRQNIIYTLFFSQTYLTTALVYIGLGYPALFAKGIKSIITTLAHSSIPWDKPFYEKKWLHPIAWVLERLISTPATHHAHHAASNDDGIGHYKGNFGNMFFIWDIIFGTGIITRKYPATYGLAHYHHEEWYAQFAWPFLKSSKEGSELSANGPMVAEDVVVPKEQSTETADVSPIHRGALITAWFVFVSVGTGLAQPARSWKTTPPTKTTFVKPAKEGSPNILWIILDDVGYGATSAFGGLIQAPVLDSIANQGLRFTNFHTTGICSPTRAALLTGRNHHAVGMGLFPHYYLSADYPGYHGHLQPSTGTIAQVLQENGYSTYQLGKWHLTPDDESTDLGPFERWPSGKGFDHNFGFLGGATDQYKPDLVEDNKHINPDGSHLNKLLADKAIGYLAAQQKIAPHKPFFLYFATGAGHAPHQVDKEWSDKYKGKFDEGWDVYREKTFANQKKLGAIPATAKLPARDPFLKAWKDLPADERHLYARFMEVYAGFLEYTDHEIGRVIQHLRRTGQLENTAIFIMVGDNGGSKEGLEYGVTTKTIRFGGESLTREEYRKFMLSEYDKIGTKEVAQVANYPLGWAQATNTPFRLWKSDANAEGATHNPLIVYYPKGIPEKGGIRNQYSHLIDLYPTVLEIAGIEQPKQIKNIDQDPLHGSSLVYAFADKTAPSRHSQQYYTIFGNRAIYKDGWKASAAHHPNSLELFTFSDETRPAIDGDPDNDVWELYHIESDFNELNNLASKNPEKLKELKALFDTEAAKYNVYPLIDIEHAIQRYSEYRRRQEQQAKR